MKFTKKALLVSVMSISLIAPMSGCSSTTEAGAVGADRKQLLLVSSEKFWHCQTKPTSRPSAKLAGQVSWTWIPPKLLA